MKRIVLFCGKFYTMRKIIFSLLTLVGAYNVNAQSVNIKFTEYDLPNGLHVILHEDHTIPTVAISVLYHVGSKNEDPTRTGFAHFFEHLLFEGTENIGRGEYMKLVQNNGGVINANTSFDRTFYFETLPSNKLEQGLWMESERMLHAKIDDIGLETQRKVVKKKKNSAMRIHHMADYLSKFSKMRIRFILINGHPLARRNILIKLNYPSSLIFIKPFMCLKMRPYLSEVISISIKHKLGLILILEASHAERNL